MPPQENQIRFPSPAEPEREIILHQSPKQAFILYQPTSVELTEFLKRFEQQILDAFWEKAVMAESPYEKGVPYGICCSSSGHSIIPTASLLTHLNIDSTGGAAKKALRAKPFSELCDALGVFKPRSISQALKELTENGRTRLKAMSLVDLAGQSGSFEIFVDKLCNEALSTSDRKRFAFCCLVAMRAQNWILLPTDAVAKAGYISKWIKVKGNIWSPEPLSFLSQTGQAVLQQLAAIGGECSKNERTSAFVKARYAVLCSSVVSVRDLSWPLAERLLFSKRSMGAIGANSGVSSAIRSRWRTLCQANGPVAMMEAYGRDYEEALRARCPKDPRLDGWIRELTAQCERYTGGNFEPLYQAFGHWLTWLTTLDDIPHPSEIRREHIYDLRNPSANCFRTYLGKLPVEKIKTRNQPLARMSDFFDSLVRESATKGKKFLNPVHLRFDTFKAAKRTVSQGTHRKRLQSWVLDKLKTFIITPDDKGGFRWNENLKKIEVLWLRVTDSDEPVFCPILPAIVFLMLEYPLRSHQVRWLDSGERDGAIYDFALKTFVPNPNHDGIQECYGVLQPSGDFDISDVDIRLDFQVAVNKVQIGERKRANFIIPYVNQQTLWLIGQVLQWQEQHGAPALRVQEVNEPTKERNRNHQIRDLYPNICPLFRYPLQRGYFPPSIQQLTYFWGQLCGQWDKHYASLKDQNTGEPIRRPDVPILSRPYRKYWRVATHDLHSLRVAGVSFLLDAGIPLEVVASIAGHRSLAMTLHYYKADHGVLRKQLQAAYARAGDSKTWEQLESQLNQCLNYESWLKGTPEGFRALRESRESRIWRISLSGICPGASCSQGLPDEYAAAHGGDVPGSKCALCKFFIYGTPFLPGLIHEYNCLLFELEQKANRQVQLRTRIEEADDKLDFGQLHILKAEAERLELECHLDLTVVGKLYVMIEECVKAYNSGETPAENSLALALPRNDEISVHVEHVGPFQRLKDLVEAAESMPASRHTGADLALRMMQDKLLYCLRVNGASCFLAGLPPEHSKRLTLELARVIEAVIPEEDQREKLIAGKIRLADLPAVDGQMREEIGQLETKADQLQLTDETEQSHLNS